MPSIAIIGVGRLGSSLALALPVEKYRIRALIVRNTDPVATLGLSELGDVPVISFAELSELDADIVVIATQDQEIAGVVEALVKVPMNVDCIFHTSGSLSSSILAPLRNNGRAVGSIHPLVSFSDPRLGAKRMSGAYFCVEGDAAAVSRGRTLAADLGGHPFTIDTKKKALYHAAAVMSSGHLVALLDLSTQLLATCGIEPDTAKQLVMPLVASTIENIKERSLPQALTGTFARADVETFERHVAALNELGDRRLLLIYLLLGDAALDLALRQNADPKMVGKMREKIEMAKTGIE